MTDAHCGTTVLRGAIVNVELYTLNGVIHNCDKSFLYIKFGYCLTWNNSTETEQLGRCLLTDKTFNNSCMRHSIPNAYHISAEISVDELDRLTCDQYTTGKGNNVLTA